MGFPSPALRGLINTLQISVIKTCILFEKVWMKYTCPWWTSEDKISWAKENKFNCIDSSQFKAFGQVAFCIHPTSSFFLYFSGKIFHWHWIVHIYKVPILEFKIISDLANPATAARQNGIIHIFLPWGLRIDSYLESLSLPKLPFWLAFIMKLPPILPALMQNLTKLFAVFRLLRKCFYNSDDVASGHNGTGNKRDSLHKHTFL